MRSGSVWPACPNADRRVRVPAALWRLRETKCDRPRIVSRKSWGPVPSQRIRESRKEPAIRARPRSHEQPAPERRFHDVPGCSRRTRTVLAEWADGGSAPRRRPVLHREPGSMAQATNHTTAAPRHHPEPLWAVVDRAGELDRAGACRAGVASLQGHGASHCSGRARVSTSAANHDICERSTSELKRSRPTHLVTPPIRGRFVADDRSVGESNPLRPSRMSTDQRCGRRRPGRMLRAPTSSVR
jgi:hypothetical protein